MFHRFHRRAPSNPTSPHPDQLTPWEAAPLHEHPQTAEDVFPLPEMRPRSSNPSNTPPYHPPQQPLPPMPRNPQQVEPDQRSDPRDHESRPPPVRSPYNGGDSGFIGGAALHNYRRGIQESPRPDASGDSLASLPQSHLSRSKPPPPPINTSFAMRPPPVPMKQQTSSFIAPTDIQASNATGRRPAGVRLVSEPPSLTAAHLTADAQKAKKGLPFLKNPMSGLLNRKKTAQSPQDLQPRLTPEDEPVYAPIRGTRVHDFSAPRPRRLVSSDLPPLPNTRAEDKPATQAGHLDSSGLQHVSEQGGRRPSIPGAGFANMSIETQHRAPLGKKQSDQALQERVRRSLDEKPLPQQPIPPVPPKDAPATSVRTASSKSRTVSVDAPSMLPKSTPSTISSRSRQISLSDASTDGVISALPKHMKSTSSRFSFMVGSANQEKLLEERHRQRELEKKTADQGSTKGPRDSRFDDFDEDSFDYDAMMDDDGLEEGIPGVNIDAEEDDYETEVDPDNDQENFSGFVFQRSNPTSTLPTPVTPGMMDTPRDFHGKVIGFAMTKDTTPDLPQLPQMSPIDFTDPNLPSKAVEDDAMAGLGIQGLDAELQTKQNSQSFQHNHLLPPVQIQPPISEDDLYFDQGLADELKFGDPEDGVPFDESIFDNNDTDRYGRPIPGAFAQAKALRTAMSQESGKRESDATSRLSGQSQVSQSTAHTSLSVGVQHFPSVTEKQAQSDALSPGIEPPLDRSQTLGEVGEEQVAAYQAALAEAAHKAAASGKFRRDSSPPPVADLTLTSPTTASERLSSQSYLDRSFHDYDDDAYTQPMDDYDFDDAIIAEANAEALANDMDGFYGQEFGFYSGPAGQGHNGGSAHSKSGGSAQLNEQNLFEYSSGGYFGPSGAVGRSTSGRIVSREPNLTPITERSEYSNRNSIMSLGLPPIGASSDLRSPGLAQLAMMADDQDMTLSALMRLRNKAFGGSQASLVQSSREGSPQSVVGGEREGATSPWTPAQQTGYLGVREGGREAHGRKNSAFSVRSRDSDGGSASGSPTLTMSFPPLPAVSPSNGMPAPVFSPPTGPPPCPPVLEDEETQEEEDRAPGAMPGSGGWVLESQPPLSASRARPGMGHRHKGSADSISYTKERGEDSETRWVVERRRTAETGEVEILGRSVVAGGRI